MAEGRNIPAAGAGDFGDQEATGGGPVAAALDGIVFIASEDSAEVGAAKAAQLVFFRATQRGRTGRHPGGPD